MKQPGTRLKPRPTQPSVVDQLIKLLMKKRGTTMQEMISVSGWKNQRVQRRLRVSQRWIQVLPHKNGYRTMNSPTTRANLDQLLTMERPELVQQWKVVFQSIAPRGAQIPLLKSVLSWKAQVDAHGQESYKALLKELRSWSSNTTVRNLDPGSELLREWKGVIHRVKVLDQGFEHQGEKYSSLTAVAHKITGTHWPGPRFFGLRK
jgi:Protein of unknown function (DUF2924)